MPGNEDNHHWERAITVRTAVGMPVAAATRALRTLARIVRPKDETAVDGVPITAPQPENNNSKSFVRFLELPPEVRQMIWKGKHNFVQQSPGEYCCCMLRIESNIPAQRRTITRNNNSAILAVSPTLDMIHFGPEFEVKHLESVVERIGPAKAKEVRHLILEYQIENAHSGNGVQRMLVPQFFKICSLLPELSRIIFVSHDRDRGSNMLFGDLIFTSLDSTRRSDVDGRTFKEFAEKQYPFYLERQLKSRDMDNIRPKIIFMEVRGGLDAGKQTIELSP